MFTVQIYNDALKSVHYRGTFPTEGEATLYAANQANRTRRFMTYQVFSGTPKNPGMPLGPKYRGAG
jgi:hypothetical protein